MLSMVLETLIRIALACMVAYVPIRCRNKNEGRCRLMLEILTGEEFVSTRSLPWLINPITNRNLELDCYCDKLKIAVEVNGDQHYKKDAYYSRDLEYQVYKDRVKEILCYQNGVTLIIIPYTIPATSLCSYIVSKLELIRRLQKDYIS